MRKESFGGLTVRLTGGSDREGGKPGDDGPLVVLCHGFGAPGDDLVPLWRVLDVPSNVRFAFPEAPLQLPPLYGGGRAWWQIDLERLQRILGQGANTAAAADLVNDVPPGLAEARDHLCAFLDEADRRLTPSRVVLGGFSQGAMLACDVALRTARPLAGLAMLSGTMIAAREWAPRFEKRAGLRVFQSHGGEDPLLPFAIAEQLRDAWVGAGATVDWIPFRGGHEIPEQVLERLGGFLTTALLPQ